MNSAFGEIVSFTLEWEGGLTTDTGGLTNYGISQKQYPEENLRRLTRARAIKMYHADYWRMIQGEELAPAVALTVFDFAVNAGRRRAIRALQRAVNSRVDGVMGPKTLHALSFYSTLHIVNEVIAARGLHYIRLASNPKYAPYVKGWARRLLACAVKAGAMA